MTQIQALLPEIPAKDHDFIIRQTDCILRSYQHWTGQPLMELSEDPKTRACELFNAPLVVASSDSEEDPLLNYGNRKALELWELDWERFRALRGRETAEPMEQKERAWFLNTVKKNGILHDYHGIRISSTGRRFRIENATVWNLLDENGSFCGQAAAFDKWEDV